MLPTAGQPVVITHRGRRYRATFIGVFNSDTYEVMPAGEADLGYAPMRVASACVELLAPAGVVEETAIELELQRHTCACGVEFLPLVSSQVYCTPECPERPERACSTQKADAVTRAVEVRRTRGGPRGPQGDPKQHRLRMNFTDDEIAALVAAAARGGEHPAEFARRAINAAARAANAVGKTRTVTGLLAVLPDDDWWLTGWKGIKQQDIKDCLEQEPTAVYEVEIAVPTATSPLHGVVTAGPEITANSRKS